MRLIEQQKHVLTGKENRDLHRKQWMAKRQRLDSLQRVVDRYRKIEDQEAEQKTAEIAGRSSAHQERFRYLIERISRSVWQVARVVGTDLAPLLSGV